MKFCEARKEIDAIRGEMVRLRMELQTESNALKAEEIVKDIARLELKIFAIKLDLNSNY